jgi:hypothetical protein
MMALRYLIFLIKGGCILLSRSEYIMYSLEYNLFFGRIMKEHLIFIESAFSIKDSSLILESDNMKVSFEDFLTEVVSLANGLLPKEVLSSNELVTPYTLNAEILTEFYTGICINTDITKDEMDLVGNFSHELSPSLTHSINLLNEKAIVLVTNLIELKSRIIKNVLRCRTFTRNYPTLLEHVLKEAEKYLRILNALQNLDETAIKNELVQKEVFWNDIMGEHSMFIRGLLDPTEKDSIRIANEFAELFEELEKKAKEVLEKSLPPGEITKESMEATEEIIDFKTQGTQGIINCKIKSIILPLMADHVLREANHYLHVLKNSN